MSLEPGRRVGPYEILSVLGSGGMGTVYLARDTRLDRRVALKFIQADSLSIDNEEATRWLMHEARAASALNHPNICQIYDVGGEGRDSWIAMEYVEGQSLAAIVRSGLPAETVIRLGAQVAHALAHAHSQGILHRDLKTANIVCDPDGRPKILDFGIARRLPRDVPHEITRADTTPQVGDLGGTLAYLAPEVIRGEPPSERSDLWSLGVVLYELLTGSVPFHGRNAFDLAASIVDGPKPRLPGHVSAELAGIMTRLLARDPAVRYRSAAEAAAALDALSSQPSLRVSRRRRSTLAALAALVVVAVITAYALWSRQRHRAITLTNQRLASLVEAPNGAPSYSPDGSMLAFTAPDANGVQQIWVRNLNQSISKQVTDGAAAASRPRWLRATNELLYARAGEGIWIVSPLGGAPTRLIERGTNPNVSLDGRRLVFEDRRLIWMAASDGSDVRRVEGIEPARFGVPMAPALSPDGSFIAYFQPDLGPNGDFWIIPSTGGAPKRLTFDLREGGWPVWSPDGRTIVVSSARGGSRTLWQIPASGSAPLPLTTGAGEDDQPDISTDGRQLAYTNVRNIWELHVRNLESREERTLMARGLELLFPMFSPDGRRIAYFARADYAVAIFTIGADGSDLRQLTNGRELNHQPRWGPDGKDIYFFQVQPSVGLRRVPAVGGPSIEFQPWNWLIQSGPYFDPTGRFIAYLRQRPPGAPQTVSEHTVIREIATGKERLWPEPHTHVTGWFPDGASIVGWQHESKSPSGQRVVVCRVADASCDRVTDGMVPKWSAHDGRLYFLRGASTAPVLWSIRLDGTDERRLGGLGMFRPTDVFFDISRDGLLCWAPFRAGHQELWTATVARQ